MINPVLLTGATGLIGKEAITPLINAGFTVYAITSKPQPSNENITWLTADLFNDGQIDTLIKKIKPEYLLHFAWNTKEGYLTSELNEKYLEASFRLLRTFTESGGKRAVCAGTCFEYEFTENLPIKENSVLNPNTPYATCKNELRVRSEVFANGNNISFGWGRIFYVMGHGENKNRLLPYIVDSLQNGRQALIKSGPLIRDYMYTKDIAAAFVRFLASPVTGCVNICAGAGISIKDFAIKIADRLGKRDLLEFQDDVANQPKIIVGDNTRLTRELAYVPHWGIDVALDNVLGGS